MNVRKNSITLSFVIALSLAASVCIAQVPSVVSAPILESTAMTTQTTITSMSATIAAMEKAEDQVRDLMKKASWARNLQTVQKLITLIEATVCNSKNITVRLSYFNSNCIWDFDFEMNLVKVSMAADFVTLLMADGVFMSTEGRLQSIRDAVKSFEEAQRALTNLNATLDNELRKQAAKKNHDAAIEAMIKY